MKMVKTWWHDVETGEQKLIDDKRIFDYPVVKLETRNMETEFDDLKQELKDKGVI